MTTVSVTGSETLLPSNPFVSIHIATFNPSTNNAQKPELTLEIIFLNSVSFETLFCGIRLLYKNFSKFNFLDGLLQPLMQKLLDAALENHLEY